MKFDSIGNRTKAILSVVSKLIISVLVIVGVILSFYNGLIGGKECFLYFTTQSNLWIGVVEFILAIFLIVGIFKKIYVLNRKLYLIQEVFVVSILLTGFIFCFVLAPAYFIGGENTTKEINNPFNPAAIILHIVIPILSLVDFLVFTRNVQFKKKECLYAVIPPIYYLCFSMIGYFCNFDFGDGRNYPYFFLNYNSPAGVFGFSNVKPYFMGSFYWLVIITFLVIGVSFVLVLIVQKLNNRSTTYEK